MSLDAADASFRIRRMAWLAIPVLAALVYAPALTNPLVYDDLYAIRDNALIRQLNLATVFWQGGLTSTGFANGEFRPLTLHSFALNYAVGGAAPWGYRLVALVLHIVNGLLVVTVLRRLLSAFRFDGRRPALTENQIEWAALLAGCLFAVHPVHSLAILLVWKRATLFVALFTLAALYLLLRLRGVGQSGRPARHPGFLIATICGLQALAILSKEVAIVTPLLLLLVDLWPRPGWSPRREGRALLKLHLPLFALSVATVIFFLKRLSPQADLAPASYLATQAKVVWFYAGLVMAPWRLAPDYDISVGSAHDGLVWLGAAGFLVVALGLALVRRRQPFLVLAALWCAIALLPTTSIIPIPFLADEDRLYIAAVLPWGWLAGWAVLISASVPRWGRKAVVLLMALVLIALSLLTLRRGVLWSDPELLWLDASERYPGSRRIAGNACAALCGNRERRALAVSVCRAAAERFPHDHLIQSNRIRLAAELGDLATAESILREEAQRGPLSARLETMAGNLEWARGRPAAAIPHYSRALEQSPLDMDSAVYLARSYAEIGLLDQARSLSAQLDRWTVPEDRRTRLSMAELHRAIGAEARACQEYLALRPALDPATLATEAAALEKTCH